MMSHPGCTLDSAVERRKGWSSQRRNNGSLSEVLNSPSTAFFIQMLTYLLSTYHIPGPVIESNIQQGTKLTKIAALLELVF